MVERVERKGIEGRREGGDGDTEPDLGPDLDYYFSAIIKTSSGYLYIIVKRIKAMLHLEVM